MTGSYGDTITIGGTGFGSDVSKVNLVIGASGKFKPFSLTDTKAVAVVPKDAQTGKVTIDLGTRLTVGVDYVSSTDNFTVKATEPLSIKSISSQDFSFVGDTIIMTGTGFGSDPQKLIISLKPIARVKPISASGNTLSFVIPPIADIESGMALFVSVVRNSLDSTTANWAISKIFPARPVIIDFYPKDVGRSDTVTIIGKNLTAPYSAILEVWAGDLYGFKIPKSSTEMQVTFIPESKIVTAPVEVRLADVGTSTQAYSRSISKDNLIVRPRTVVYFVSSSANEYDHSNSTAKIGETVTINGTFTADEYSTMKVRFAGSSVDVKPELSGAVNNRFKVKVPADAKSGPVKVTRQDWAPGTTQNDLTILP